MSEVIAEYKVKVDKAVSDLNKVADEWQDVDKASVKAGVDGQKAIEGVEKSTKSFLSTLKNVAGALGIAFGVQQLISFGKEAVTVAAKAEGIKKAFDKLNSPNLLADLRKATRGTVSDLDLMQKAVQAKNFQLPLDKLAQLFQFATNRAIETGESVDYLVESIVLGISRKSIPILDNLGISSVQIQEEMKKTGDFAQAAFNIVNKSMADAGDVADTTTVKLAQLSTIWDNFKVAVGESIINKLNELQTDAETTSKSIEELTGGVDGFNIVMFALNNLLTAIASPFKRVNELVNLGVKALNFGKESAISFGNAMKEAAYRLTLNNDELIAFYKLSDTGKKILVDQYFGIKDINDIREDELFQIQQVANATSGLTAAQAEQIKNVAYYTKLIADLTEEQKADGTTLKRNAELNIELADATEKLNALLGKETDAQKKLREELEKIALIRKQVFTGAEMSDGVPVVVALSSTIKGLNDLLKEQRDILNTSPEFSQQYKDASIELDKLQKKLDDFNDDFIDPSKGFEGVSATGAGLLDFGSSNDSIIGDDELEEWMKYAEAVIGINELISSAIIAGHDRELQSLEAQLDAGQITREEYDKKRRKLERKKAADEKASAMFTAVISLATAVLSALNTVPFLPLGPIMAALAAGLGAVQIGVIASQPLPAFKDGVIGLKGKGTGTSDEIDAKLSNGESVMTAAETKKYNAELWAIRKGTFDKLIMAKYVKPMIDESLFKGMGDIGKSADLNGLTANLKDHNIIAGLDRLRQSQTYGFKFLAKELKSGRNQKRGGYNA